MTRIWQIMARLGSNSQSCTFVVLNWELELEVIGLLINSFRLGKHEYLVNFMSGESRTSSPLVLRQVTLERFQVYDHLAT